MIIVAKKGDKIIEAQSCTVDNKTVVLAVMESNMALAGFSASEVIYSELTDEQYNTQ